MTSAESTAIGVTGHQVLSEATQRLVLSAIRAHLETFDVVLGVTSLAAGADQIFARAVLASGGGLLVVIPSQDYESSFSSERDRSSFRKLRERATECVVLSYPKPSQEAYWAAGREIVDRSEHVIAVWDGKPAAGLGGTADVVRYAQVQGKDVQVVWPTGASRE